MKGLLLVLGIAALAFVAWADEAQATTVCQGGTGPVNANVCQGYGHVSTTTGGVASARCFAVRTTNTAPTCSTSGLTPQNEAWQMTAGSCLTFYYFETTSGAVPPLTPNKLVLSVAIENTGTAPIVYKDGTVPPDASGTSYSFCATSDGTAVGSPRAGTYRIFLRAIKDNAVPSTGNYNINNDGAATVGSLINYDRAALRGQMLVSSIARNAYPAGSTFAYGVAGDESVQITATFTQPNGDVGNAETMRNGVVDEATFAVGVAGATTDVDATTLVQSFVVDSTFPFANNPYIGATEVVGTSVVTGSKWTVFASSGHGSCIVVVSDLVVYCSDDIAIDPRIYFDADGTGSPDGLAVVKLGSSSGALTSVFNRGETYYAEWYLFNARSELLSRAMTHTTEDALDVTCTSHGSLTPASNKYSVTVAIPTAGSCAVAATEAGSPRYLMASNTDQGAESGQVFAVSSLLFVDAHPQDSGTLVPDDYPTEDAAETLEFFVRDDGAGGDDSDHVRPFCKVETVRHTDYDTSGSAVSWNIKDPTTATRASGTSDTGSDGWTPVLADFLTATPLGTWPEQCTATHNGNTGTDTETFTIGVEGGGATEYTGVDPMTVNVAWYEGYLNQSQLVSVTARFLDGTPRLDAESEMNVDIYWPDGTLDINGATPVEVGGGIYHYEYTADGGPGNYEIVLRNDDPPTMGGAASNAFTVQNATGNLTADLAALVGQLQDHRDNSLEILGMSFNDLEFDGFLVTLAWFAMLLYCLVKFRVFAGFVATLGLLESVIPTIMPGSFLGYLMLLILAVWLEAVAGERIYSRWLNKKTKTSDAP